MMIETPNRSMHQVSIQCSCWEIKFLSHVNLELQSTLLSKSRRRACDLKICSNLISQYFLHQNSRDLKNFSKSTLQRSRPDNDLKHCDFLPSRPSSNYCACLHKSWSNSVKSFSLILYYLEIQRSWPWYNSRPCSRGPMTHGHVRNDKRWFLEMIVERNVNHHMWNFLQRNNPTMKRISPLSSIESFSTKLLVSPTGSSTAPTPMCRVPQQQQ